jgi:erythronate-4-phosphate dehydrogenase
VNIIADRDIPFVGHYFSGFGRLELVAGRDIDRPAVRAADMLIIRTVTMIDEALLSGSRVRIVASLTSGCDHVDLQYLRSAGIAFFEAAGCNARSVAEYVLSSLFAVAASRRIRLEGRTVGIIGHGHVGSLVREFLQALGFRCLLNDPPLAAATGGAGFEPLGALSDADILTFHVPLETGGEHPTRHLVNAAFLARLKRDAVLINTSRGQVIDEPALSDFLDACPQACAVLDVWSGEPEINTNLLSRVLIGTPHIAGYSIDGRLRAAADVSGKIRQYLQLDGAEIAPPPLPAPANAGLDTGTPRNEMEGLAAAVLAAYDVRQDGAPLRRLLQPGAPKPAEMFRAARSSYRVRREFGAYSVRVPAEMHGLRQKLAALGFGPAEERHGGG